MKKIILMALISYMLSFSFAQSWEIPLFTAIERNSFSEIKKLVEQGEDVNQDNFAGQFPLEYAVWHECDIEILQYLIEHGAAVNPTIISVNSEPPLLRSLDKQNASFETVKFLVKFGADIKALNHYGDSALMIAAKNVDDMRIIDFLIQTGIDINIKNKYERTALHLAASAQKPNTIKVLIQAGADINAKTNDGDTPLIVAVNTLVAKYETAEQLVKLGANLNLQNKKGMTALMGACKKVTIDSIIKLLLDFNADATLEDETGRTALEYLDSNKSKYIRESLIRKRLKDMVYKR